MNKDIKILAGQRGRWSMINDLILMKKKENNKCWV